MNPGTVHFKHWLANQLNKPIYQDTHWHFKKLFVPDYKNKAVLKQKTNVTSKAPPVPITCTFSRPGKKGSARGKNLAASQTLLIRRRHFLLHKAPPPLCSLSSAPGHAPRPTSQASFPGSSSLHHAGSDYPRPHSLSAPISLFRLTSPASPPLSGAAEHRGPPPNATLRRADHAVPLCCWDSLLPRFLVPPREPDPAAVALSSQDPAPWM